MVFCDDCIREYKPYTYSETLYRTLISGVNEWEGPDEEYEIKRRYWAVLDPHRRHESNVVGKDKYENIRYRDINTTISNMFPSVEDFNSLHRNFNIERRKKISASFLCFDCEKYLCAKCITGHTEHFMFSEDDKNNMVKWGILESKRIGKLPAYQARISRKNSEQSTFSERNKTDKWDKIEAKIVQVFGAEGDEKERYIQQERAVLCDVIDLREMVSESEWKELMLLERHDIVKLQDELNKSYNQFFFPVDSLILNDQILLVTDSFKRIIQVYNINGAGMDRSIKLASPPYGITEIPSKDPSRPLIAVSFPEEQYIDIMDIYCDKVQIISRINVRGECADLAFCKDKLITMCNDRLGRGFRHSIHVIHMSGEITIVIDVNKLLDIKPNSFSIMHMSVRSEIETIYVCHNNDPSCVVSMSLDGHVLHSVTFTDIRPTNICVGNDQNVYVMFSSLGRQPLYRFSSDLGQKNEIVESVCQYTRVDDQREGIIRSVTVSDANIIVHHKNKMFIVTKNGYVYVFSLV